MLADGDIGSLNGAYFNCYQGDGIFDLNNSEVKMVLKNVAFILRLRVMSPTFQPSEKYDQLSKRDFF